MIVRVIVEAEVKDDWAARELAGAILAATEKIATRQVVISEEITRINKLGGGTK